MDVLWKVLIEWKKIDIKEIVDYVTNLSALILFSTSSLGQKTWVWKRMLLLDQIFYWDEIYLTNYAPETFKVGS